MRLAEKLDWKGLKIKKGVGNRKIIMSDEVGHRIGKGLIETGRISLVIGREACIFMPTCFHCIATDLINEQTDAFKTSL
jgi:hypothetical protein